MESAPTVTSFYILLAFLQQLIQLPNLLSGHYRKGEILDICLAQF